MTSNRLRDTSWWDDLLWKTAIPALAVFALVMTVPDIPTSIAAARNEGNFGTFTAQRADCGGRGGCTYYGKFVSEDGAVTLDDVFIDAGAHGVGETVPAQFFEDGSFGKVYETNSRDIVWLTLLLVGSVLYLLGWGWFAVRPWLRRRRA